MLYDKRWDKQIAADPFTLPSLIAWLERQPADTIYCYQSNGRCLLAQYLAFLGHGDIVVCGWGKFITDRASGQFPDACWQSATDLPWTFGAALERARKLSASNK